MNELIIAIRLHVDRMSAALGMSPEHVMRDCSIRELLLSIATEMRAVANPEPLSAPPQAGASPDDVAAFAAEVLGG